MPRSPAAPEARGRDPEGCSYADGGGGGGRPGGGDGASCRLAPPGPARRPRPDPASGSGSSGRRSQDPRARGNAPRGVDQLRPVVCGPGEHAMHCRGKRVPSGRAAIIFSWPPPESGKGQVLIGNPSSIHFCTVSMDQWANKAQVKQRCPEVREGRPLACIACGQSWPSAHTRRACECPGEASLSGSGCAVAQPRA